MFLGPTLIFLSSGIHLFKDLADGAKKEKYEGIAETVFRFFRGTNHLFWQDNACDPRLQVFGGSPETTLFICADLHPDNVGTYLNGEKDVVYGLNDFDDSVVADYQMDLLRMTVGIALMCLVNGRFDGAKYTIAHGKPHDEIAKYAIDPFLASYAAEICRLAEEQPPREEVTDLTTKTAQGPIAKLLKKMSKKDPGALLAKATKKVDGKLDIDYSKYDKYLVASESDKEKIYQGLLQDYRKHVENDHEPKAEDWNKIRAIARRAGAGTGSLGLERYIVLVYGRKDDDSAARVLDIKTQPLPQPAHFLPPAQRAAYDAAFGDNHARRVIHGAHALCLHPDKHLGWFTSTFSDGSPEHFSVREVTSYKGGLDTADKLESMEDYTSVCSQWGQILARAHYRTKGHNGSEGAENPAVGIAARIKGKETAFVEHLKAWGFEYTGTVCLDYTEFKANALLLAISSPND